MKITDWALSHPNKNIAVIICNGRIMNNYFVKFNITFLEKYITIKAECPSGTGGLIRLPNETRIYLLKECVVNSFFTGRRFSAIFYEEGISNDALARAMVSLDTFTDYNEVLFKEFRI